MSKKKSVNFTVYHEDRDDGPSRIFVYIDDDRMNIQFELTEKTAKALGVALIQEASLCTTES